MLNVRSFYRCSSFFNRIRVIHLYKDLKVHIVLILKMEEEKEKSRVREIQDKTKKKWNSFRKTVWNSEKKEFFGRTALSWAKILIFYFVFFYPFLLAFWYCMMLVLFQTLNYDAPKYRLEKSVIGLIPALGYRPTPPMPPNSLKTGVIKFDSNRSETFDDWISGLNTFLEPYSKQDGAENCSMDKHTTRKRICFVDVKADSESCTKDSGFGYKQGKPCVLVKLNRIYDWIPKSFSEDEIPTELKDLIKEGFEKDLVYVTCVGETEADKDNVGEIVYLPKQGIPSYYYPFTNQERYLSPFVFIKFRSIKRGVVVEVRCRAWFKNVGTDYFPEKTSVLIKLQVD